MLINIIVGFIPKSVDVLSGLGIYMFLQGVTCWIIAIAIIILTGGRQGFALEDDN